MALAPQTREIILGVLLLFSTIVFAFWFSKINKTKQEELDKKALDPTIDTSDVERLYLAVMLSFITSLCGLLAFSIYIVYRYGGERFQKSSTVLGTILASGAISAASKPTEEEVEVPSDLAERGSSISIPTERPSPVSPPSEKKEATVKKEEELKIPTIPIVPVIPSTKESFSGTAEVPSISVKTSKYEEKTLTPEQLESIIRVENEKKAREEQRIQDERRKEEENMRRLKESLERAEREKAERERLNQETKRAEADAEARRIKEAIEKAELDARRKEIERADKQRKSEETARSLREAYERLEQEKARVKQESRRSEETREKEQAERLRKALEAQGVKVAEEKGLLTKSYKDMSNREIAQAIIDRKITESSLVNKDLETKYNAAVKDNRSLSPEQKKLIEAYMKGGANIPPITNYLYEALERAFGLDSIGNMRKRFNGYVERVMKDAGKEGSDMERKITANIEMVSDAELDSIYEFIKKSYMNTNDMRTGFIYVCAVFATGALEGTTTLENIKALIQRATRGSSTSTSSSSSDDYFERSRRMFGGVPQEPQQRVDDKLGPQLAIVKELKEGIARNKAKDTIRDDISVDIPRIVVVGQKGEVKTEKEAEDLQRIAEALQKQTRAKEEKKKEEVVEKAKDDVYEKPRFGVPTIRFAEDNLKRVEIIAKQLNDLGFDKKDKDVGKAITKIYNQITSKKDVSISDILALYSAVQKYVVNSDSIKSDDKGRIVIALNDLKAGLKDEKFSSDHLEFVLRVLRGDYADMIAGIGLYPYIPDGYKITEKCKDDILKCIKRDLLELLAEMSQKLIQTNSYKTYMDEISKLAKEDILVITPEQFNSVFKGMFDTLVAMSVSKYSSLSDVITAEPDIIPSSVASIYPYNMKDQVYIGLSSNPEVINALKSISGDLDIKSKYSTTNAQFNLDLIDAFESYVNRIMNMIAPPNMSVTTMPATMKAIMTTSMMHEYGTSYKDNIDANMKNNASDMLRRINDIYKKGVALDTLVSENSTLKGYLEQIKVFLTLYLKYQDDEFKQLRQEIFKGSIDRKVAIMYLLYNLVYEMIPGMVDDRTIRYPDKNVLASAVKQAMGMIEQINKPINNRNSNMQSCEEFNKSKKRYVRFIETMDDDNLRNTTISNYEKIQSQLANTNTDILKDIDVVLTFFKNAQAEDGVYMSFKKAFADMSSVCDAKGYSSPDIKGLADILAKGYAEIDALENVMERIADLPRYIREYETSTSSADKEKIVSDCKKTYGDAVCDALFGSMIQKELTQKYNGIKIKISNEIDTISDPKRDTPPTMEEINRIRTTLTRSLAECYGTTIGKEGCDSTLDVTAIQERLFTLEGLILVIAYADIVESKDDDSIKIASLQALKDTIDTKIKACKDVGLDSAKCQSAIDVMMKEGTDLLANVSKSIEAYSKNIEDAKALKDVLDTTKAGIDDIIANIDSYKTVADVDRALSSVIQTCKANPDNNKVCDNLKDSLKADLDVAKKKFIEAKRTDMNLAYVSRIANITIGADGTPSDKDILQNCSAEYGVELCNELTTQIDAKIAELNAQKAEIERMEKARAEEAIRIQQEMTRQAEEQERKEKERLLREQKRQEEERARFEEERKEQEERKRKEQERLRREEEERARREKEKQDEEKRLRLEQERQEQERQRREKEEITAKRVAELNSEIASIKEVIKTIKSRISEGSDTKYESIDQLNADIESAINRIIKVDAECDALDFKCDQAPFADSLTNISREIQDYMTRSTQPSKDDTVSSLNAKYNQCVSIYGSAICRQLQTYVDDRKEAIRAEVKERIKGLASAGRDVYTIGSIDTLKSTINRNIDTIYDPDEDKIQNEALKDEYDVILESYKNDLILAQKAEEARQKEDAEKASMANTISREIHDRIYKIEHPPVTSGVKMRPLSQDEKYNIIRPLRTCIEKFDPKNRDRSTPAQFGDCIGGVLDYLNTKKIDPFGLRTFLTEKNKELPHTQEYTDSHQEAWSELSYTPPAQYEQSYPNTATPEKQYEQSNSAFENVERSEGDEMPRTDLSDIVLTEVSEDYEGNPFNFQKRRKPSKRHTPRRSSPSPKRLPKRSKKSPSHSKKKPTRKASKRKSVRRVSPLRSVSDIINSRSKRRPSKRRS